MSDLSDLAKLAVLTIIGTPLVLAFLVYFSKEAIKSFLFVGAHNSINEHKQVLDTYTEAMKHSLQREMIRVDSYVKGRFTVYPTLYEKILKSQGSISSLFGARYVTNQDRFSEADLQSQLEKANVVDGEIQHILSEFRRDRDDGLKSFNAMMREIEFQRTQNLYYDAKNYLILNELFMSKEVAERTFGLLKDMWSVWVDGKVSQQSGGHYDKSKEVAEGNKRNDAAIGELKDLMRRELEPEPPK